MKKIGVGLLGIGVIGSEVATVLKDRQDIISKEVGAEVYLKRIKVLEKDLERPVVRNFDRSIFTTSDDEFFNDDDIQIIIELIGGEHPAYDYQKKALESGRHVVTANKEVLGKHLIELLDIANEKEVTLNYEASVGGGMPLIAPLSRDLILNNVNSLYAIINGTTNYILTKMTESNQSFEETLKDAQRLGFAEANPVKDIDGWDATYKLAILTDLAFRTVVNPDDIYREGITNLHSIDFDFAKKMGYSIKLLSIAKQVRDKLELRVHPTFIPEINPLSNVNEVFNAAIINGDLTGDVTLIGKGAGPAPTSSSVVGDVIKAAKVINSGSFLPVVVHHEHKPLLSIDDIITKYYIHVTGTRDDLTAEINRSRIKALKIMQEGSECAILTDLTRESMLRSFVSALKEKYKVHNIIRVED